MHLPTRANITVSSGAAGNETVTLNSSICSRSTETRKIYLTMCNKYFNNGNKVVDQRHKIIIYFLYYITLLVRSQNTRMTRANDQNLQINNILIINWNTKRNKETQV